MHNDIFNRHTSRLLALAALTATAVAAQAADQASNPNGLMTFPHSYVVAQAPAAKPGAAQQSPAAQGVKAFKDPVTGELTAPTAEQAADLEAATPVSTQRKVFKAAPAPASFALPNGGVGLMLDESQMSYSVAHKDATGKLVEECLPNQSAAMSSVRTQRKAAKKVEAR